MPQSKRSAQRKRRSKVALALGAAGPSLSLASSASAAIGGMNEAGSAPVLGPNSIIPGLPDMRRDRTNRSHRHSHNRQNQNGF